VISMISLSEVRAYTTDHLTDAAQYWEHIADRWEDTTWAVNNQALALDWEGQGYEALKARTNADHLATARHAEKLRDAAGIARNAASGLDAAQRRVLYAVEDAENDGYRVGDDYSVTDTRNARTTGERSIRQAGAQAYGADLKLRIGEFWERETATGAKLTTIAGDVGSMSFDKHNKPVDFAPLSTFTPLPDVSLVWCVKAVLSFVCTQHFPDGTTFTYPSPTDRSGVVTQH
jgi:hypothetical protein